ncbi:MAG: SDR family oxidoreductase [Verrucomicrobia bacterium]|nr:SDR family oxidoreductase [Verrucomicrobiota bacterium]
MSNPVLITGGMGYIGSRLACAMLKAGTKVRLGTRHSEQPVPEQLAGAEPVKTDFASVESLKNACAGIKQIVHLAALNDADCALDPIKAFEINVLGTLRLMEAARCAGIERFLYLSTAHVYRSPLVGTLTEETLPRPAHIYGITHKAAEDLVLADTKGMAGVVIRLANGFGAPVHAQVNCWMLLANDLCRQAVTSRKLVLKSTGMQQRNFITSTDVTNAITHFLQLPREQLGDGIFNIGSHKSMTVLAMTELIADRCEQVLGFRPTIHRPSGDTVSASLHFDVSRAEAVGFIPADDYAEEVDECLRFCSNTFLA